MSYRRMFSCLTVGAVLAASPAPVAHATAQRAAAAELIVAHQAVMDTPGAGFPKTDLAYRRLANGSLNYDRATGRITGVVTLQGSPPPGQAPRITVAYGYWDQSDGYCSPLTPRLSWSGETPPAGVVRTGPSYAFDVVDSTLVRPPTDTPVECAYVITSTESTASADAAEFDVLDDRRVDSTFAVPALQITRVTPTALVRGVWTTIDVDLRNAGIGSAGAGSLVAGPGWDVRSPATPELAGGETGSVRLEVRLTGKARVLATTLSLVTPEQTVTAPQTIRRIKPPPRPRAGLWKGKGGATGVTFRVTGSGKVKGFELGGALSCGGGTFTPWPWKIPTMKVAENGRVQQTRVDPGRSLSTTYYADLLFAAKKVTGWVSADNGCSGYEEIRAKWVRR